MPTAFLGSVMSYAMYFKGHVFIEGHENYQKRSTRNKCYIKTSQGKKSISIPLQSGKNNQQSIQKVRISYVEHWIKEFKHGMETNYSSSPYIHYYLPEIIKIIQKRPASLWELNWELNLLILHFIGINDAPQVTPDWQKDYGDHSLDFRSTEPTYSLDYKYPQLFEEKGQDFIKNLSILDLLFCCGPEARGHLINLAENVKP